MRVPSAPKIVVPAFNNGHWLFPEQMGNAIGFIYVVRDNYMERFYLGKKLFRVMKGKNKGKETSWKYYTSSSKLLAEMFDERGDNEFDFICLDQYTTKSGLSYAETWSLCHVEAPTTKDWYNTRVEAVSWPVKEMVKDRHKARLERAINLEPESRLEKF